MIKSIDVVPATVKNAKFLTGYRGHLDYLPRKADVQKEKISAMAYLDLVSPLHKKTVRDYLGRVNEIPKAEAATLARKWGIDYWDGDRKTGYGGMRYDGRWLPVGAGTRAAIRSQTRPARTGHRLRQGFSAL